MWQLPLVANVCLLPTYIQSFITADCATNRDNMKVTNILAGFTSSVAATNLYVSSYGGNITSLRLSASPHGGYTLETTALNDGSAPSPSWLTKDEYNDVIYCVDEALSGGNGSIASYKPSTDGTLTIIDRHATLNGPVSTVVYNEGKALAAAL
jgi:hypothetical protein